ncbi:MAG: hypothetical protein JSS07_04105 [Proteobacteria bacterium]|nr:hypothetical protein [Pseudomonadota bacterium]
MLNFKSQCKKINKTFMLVIDKNPFAATLMLANLYCSFKLAPEDPNLKATLFNIKSELSPSQIQMLFNTVTGISPIRLKLMSHTNVAALSLLTHNLIQDIDFFKHLSIKALITLGQDISFYREVLVALIRKHYIENKMADPFNNPNFSYELLARGAAEQNHLYFASFINTCSIFPLDNIVSLGTNNPEIAVLILIDLKDTQAYFEVSYRFAKEAKLSQEIANEWKNHIETLPLTLSEEKFIQKTIPALVQFPEFQTIELTERIKHNNRVPQHISQNKALMKLLLGINLAAISTSIGISCYLSQLGFVMAVPAITTTLPICYAIGFGMHYLLKNSAEINMNEINVTHTSQHPASLK